MKTWLPSDPASREPSFLAWLEEHGFAPADVYRVDVDGDRLTAHRFHDVAGRKHLEAQCPDRIRIVTTQDGATRSVTRGSRREPCRLAPSTVKLRRPAP